nr:aspartyl-tRNA synthetase [Tanacetum cinerariifolium]
MMPGVCWEVMEERRGVVRNGGVGQKTGEVGRESLAGKLEVVYSSDQEDPDKEAYYMALTEAVKESIWLKGLLIELEVNLRSMVVNYDNQSAIHLSRNAMFHERTKHINVRYHFIREIVDSIEIEVAKIGTNNNAANAVIKVVPGPKFKYCMKILGVGIN